MKDISILYMLKRIIYKCYWISCIKPDYEKILEYYLLTDEEIIQLSLALNLFTTTTISETGIVFDNGIMFINFEIGTLKYEYSSFSRSKVKQELLLKIKQFYYQEKNLYPKTYIASLTENHLIIGIAVSQMGFDKIAQIENHINMANKKIIHEKSKREKKLNEILKNKSNLN